MRTMWRPEHNALLDSRMVGRSLDAHNECSAPALMEETPKALRVAVVEDDPRIQQLISAEITDEGHACICFGSAEDFLDEAGSDRFDLLLDLMLSGIDGLAALEAQSSRDRPVRQASSKRLRSMGTAAPPPRSSLRSWDVITRWRTRPSSD